MKGICKVTRKNEQQAVPTGSRQVYAVDMYFKPTLMQRLLILVGFNVKINGMINPQRTIKQTLQITVVK